MQREMLTYPTWERYTVLSHVISNMTIRDRRIVFQHTRSHATCCEDVFFPRFGFTLGEFAVWYTLGDRRRKAGKQNLQAL